MIFSTTAAGLPLTEAEATSRSMARRLSGHFVALDEERGRGGDLQGHVLDEGAEAFVAGDEVGLAIDFDEHADFVADMDVGADDAFLGFAAGFFRGGGGAFFAQDGFGGGEVALGFDEGFLAVHHACAGFFAELFDEVGGDFGGGGSWGCHGNSCGGHKF